MFRFIKSSVLTLVLVLAFIITTRAVYADGAWIVTDNGTKIQNAYSEPNETGTWSGGADNDKYATGKGIAQWFETGTLVMSYEGNMLQGKASGKGILTWSDGDRYEGDFVDGNMTGMGIFTCISDDRYEGEFVNGQMNGFGIYYYPDGTIKQGKWVNDEFVG